MSDEQGNDASDQVNFDPQKVAKTLVGQLYTAADRRDRATTSAAKHAGIAIGHLMAESITEHARRGQRANHHANAQEAFTEAQALLQRAQSYQQAALTAIVDALAGKDAETQAAVLAEMKAIVEKRPAREWTTDEARSTALAGLLGSISTQFDPPHEADTPAAESVDTTLHDQETDAASDTSTRPAIALSDNDQALIAETAMSVTGAYLRVAHDVLGRELTSASAGEQQLLDEKNDTRLFGEPTYTDQPMGATDVIEGVHGQKGRSERPGIRDHLERAGAISDDIGRAFALAHLISPEITDVLVTLADNRLSRDDARYDIAQAMGELPAQTELLSAKVERLIEERSGGEDAAEADEQVALATPQTRGEPASELITGMLDRINPVEDYENESLRHAVLGAAARIAANDVKNGIAASRDEYHEAAEHLISAEAAQQLGDTTRAEEEAQQGWEFLRSAASNDAWTRQAARAADSLVAAYPGTGLEPPELEARVDAAPVATASQIATGLFNSAGEVATRIEHMLTEEPSAEALKQAQFELARAQAALTFIEDIRAGYGQSDPEAPAP